MVVHQERIERLNLLVTLIPSSGNAGDFPNAAYLLQRLGRCYEHLTTPASRLRAIQRDLKNLTDTHRIEVVEAGAKPLRYRRRHDAVGPGMRSYSRKLLQTVIADALPARNLAQLWPRLITEDSGIDLGDDKLRIVTDTLRLVPADIKPGVLTAILEALSLSCTLHGCYRDAKGTLTHPLLHPQAVMQRGPRVYLYALKDDETEPVRLYALHRMIHAEIGEEAARRADNFDLQHRIDSGYADFGSGQVASLQLRARGYVADLLRDCPLSETQQIVDEDDGSAFEILVRATVPTTGQLLRWLLGCGDKIQLLEPEDLRRMMAAQSEKMAGLYVQTHNSSGSPLLADPAFTPDDLHVAPIRSA